MQSILIILIALFIQSCGFSNNDDGEQVGITASHEELKPIDSTSLDSDGDGIYDTLEREQGRNPYIGDLPKINSRFLQNFKISGVIVDKAGVEQNLEINTQINADDSDFKYRVGKIFARSNSFKVAAGVGQYSSHSWGEIGEHDLTWIKYPDVGSAFYHHEVLKNKSFFEVTDIKSEKYSVTFENSMKLKANGLFQSIKNLKLNFYYYNYESESYELIGSKDVERHFLPGVREVFSVTLENIPRRLVEDNFLKKGEFIISEISDYEIPDLNMTHEKLLAQIRSKSIPVVLNTPDQSEVFYIGINGVKDSFAGILSKGFSNQFKIETNHLIKIGQFENALPDYTYLKEIRGLDKVGKWFVLTNYFNQHYLDYKYSPQDRIVLSYVTGSDLAAQKDEVISSYRSEITGGDDSTTLAVGNVSPNSMIDIQIKPKQRYGSNLESFTEILDDPGGSCGQNCMRRPVYCKWEINKFSSYREPLVFKKSLAGDTSKIELVLNNESYSLSKLKQEKKIDVYWKEENLHISIKDISLIKEIQNFEENILAVKINSFTENTFWGVKLVSVDRYWQGRGGCPMNTVLVAGHFGVSHVSNDSIHLDRVLFAYNNVLTDEGRANIKMTPSAPYYQKIEVDISSTIKNYFN